MSTPVGQSRLQPLQPTHRRAPPAPRRSPAARSVDALELARERQAQRVRAAAGQVLLVARDAIARAHRAGVELAAVAVVVAHLDRLGQAAARVAAAARRGGRLGERIVLHVPRRPVEHRLQRNRPVARRDSGTGSVVHLRRIDDPVRGEQADRIEPLLDGAEGGVDAGAELPGDPFAAAQAVAVLAAVGALELAHQHARFLGDGAHLGGAVGAHVEDRPHVQRADRGMRVPGAARAVAARTPRSARRCSRPGARAARRSPR